MHFTLSATQALVLLPQCWLLEQEAPVAVTPVRKGGPDDPVVLKVLQC